MGNDSTQPRDDDGHEDSGLLGVTMDVIAMPIRACARIARAPGADGTARSGLGAAATWAAFAPLILVYELFAVPLVAGTVVLLAAILLPTFAIAFVMNAVYRPRATAGTTAGAPAASPREQLTSAAG